MMSGFLITRVMHIVFLEHGLTLNWKKGKTEALIVFNGAGSSMAKKEVFIELQGRVPFKNGHGHE